MTKLNSCGRGLIFLLLSVIFVPRESFASCEMSKDPNIALFISPETKTWGSFSDRSSLTPSLVGKCFEDAGKQLMITLSVVQPGVRSNVRHSYFFNNYRPEKCSFENSEVIKKADDVVKTDFFEKQFNFLRSCFDVVVKDPTGQPVTVKAKQKYCQARQNADGSATLAGDMCFVKIRSRNQFQITPVLREECKGSEAFAQLNIPAQDLLAEMDVFVAGDDSGNSEDLTQIGSRDIRLNLVPSSLALPLTDDNGPESPRFAARYNVDVDIGEISLRPQGDQITLRTSLFASNISKETCSDVFCASSSAFLQPVFGQFQLFELSPNGKKTLIDEWWDGGFAHPNWQGYISGIEKNIDSQILDLKKRYQIEISFQDPTDDYAIYVSNLRQILINMDGFGGGAVGLASIPSLSNLQALGVLPYFAGLEGLRGGDGQVNLQAIINGLNSVVKNNIWPSFYNDVCSPMNSPCMKLGSNKFYQNLKVEFNIGTKDPESGEFILEAIKTQKDSKVFRGYPLKLRSLPKISCEGE